MTASSSSGSLGNPDGGAERQRQGSNDSDGAEPGQGIVVFSDLRWDLLWQRPQQILSRLAETHPILYIEEPRFDLEEDAPAGVSTVNPYPNVHVACLHIAPKSCREKVDALRRAYVLEALRNQAAFAAPVFWYYNAADFKWSQDLGSPACVVYDCFDASAAPEDEARLLARADIVFAGGKGLADQKGQHHANVHFLASGVEYDHFAQAQHNTLAIPEDIQTLSKPIIGWFGVIDERMDYGLLAVMAAMRPMWSFALIGPIVNVDPRSLPAFANLHWFGLRPFQDLPAYCTAFDVCMMPFALNQATRYINPSKALEYLATGKPVISTPVHDIVAQYSGIIPIAATPDEFVHEIETVLTAPSLSRVMSGIKLARDSGWDQTVFAMWSLVDQTIAAKSHKRLSLP